MILHELRAKAIELLGPTWKTGEIVLLETSKQNQYVISIPNFMDPQIREPLEDSTIQNLICQDDTEVLYCVAVVSGGQLEIPSWNLRSRLIQINPNNLQTKTLLCGGGEVFHVKHFSDLLPSKS